MKNINNYLIALLVMGLISCGSEEYSKTTGGVTARAVWPDERTVSQSVSAAVMPPSIKTVRMIVSGPGMKDVQDDFPAAAGKGTVHEIPAGADRTVTFHGLDADSILTYEGMITGITIISGQTTDAGKAYMCPMNPPDPPYPPSNVKAVAGDREVKLEWDSCATSFKVYRNIVTGVSKINYIDDITHDIEDISISPIQYTWTGNENGAPLENGTTYYFVVTAVNKYGESEESEEVNATPQSSDSLDPPSNISAAAKDKKVTLNWNSVDGATNYKVYRNIVPGVSKFNYIDQIITSSMPYTWTGIENGAPLENGTTYYFVVTAVDKYGESEESEEVNATPTSSVKCIDNDNDDYGVGSDCLGPDCDDNDSLIPGPEVCDSKDNDCDTIVDNGCDDDNDNYCDDNMNIIGTPGTCTAGGADCNDNNNAINPGAAEICDNKDNNCDEKVDETFTDKGDSCTVGIGECRRTGSIVCNESGTGTTCDATPGSSSTEICDGKDNDCNTIVDNGCDDDNDNYCDANMTVIGTPGTCTAGGGDCNDNNNAINPGAAEICDNKDNDCDGDVLDCDIVGIWTLYENLCEESPEFNYDFSYDMNIDNDGTYEANGAYNADDMISYYRMDDLTDYKGGPTASCSSCPTAVPGYMGGAMDFGGVAAEVNVADVNQFDWAANASFSVAFWMKKDSACSLTNEVIVGRDDSSSDLHWWIGINCTLPDDKYTKGALQFTLIDKNNVILSVGGKSVLTDGNWHHVVAVRDAANSENIIYVDGQRENSDTKSFSTGFDSETAPLNIGWLNLDKKGFYYAGLLDELATYDIVLSGDEIRLHYQFDSYQEGFWTVTGNKVALTFSDSKGDRVYTGTVTGNQMDGTKVDYDGSKSCWYAEKR